MEREQVQAQLIYEIHRLLMSTSHLVKCYAHDLGLQERDGEALLIIWRCGLNGAAPTSSELAEDLGVTRAAVSYLVGRLVAQGYVERLPDQDDRRKTRLVLSKASQNVGHGFLEPLSTTLSARFLSRSEEEIKMFTEMLSELTNSLSA